MFIHYRSVQITINFSNTAFDMKPTNPFIIHFIGICHTLVQSCRPQWKPQKAAPPQTIMESFRLRIYQRVEPSISCWTHDACVCVE